MTRVRIWMTEKDWRSVMADLGVDVVLMFAERGWVTNSAEAAAEVGTNYELPQNPVDGYRYVLVREARRLMKAGQMRPQHVRIARSLLRELPVVSFQAFEWVDE